MGGDGGSIPKRKERVKNSRTNGGAARDTRLDANERWKLCPISNHFIRKPVMAGHWGHLMSKEGMLEFLIKLHQDSLEAHHIREESGPVTDSLHTRRDAVELKLKDNPALDKLHPSDEEWKKGHFVCPITGLETNGKHKFVFSWQCGCVVSERALKECASHERKCLVCEKPYEEYDIVVINPDSEDLVENQGKFMARKMVSAMKRKGLPVDESAMILDGAGRKSSGLTRQEELSKPKEPSDRSACAPGSSRSSASSSSSRSKRSRSDSSSTWGKRSKNSDTHR